MARVPADNIAFRIADRSAFEAVERVAGLGVCRTWKGSRTGKNGFHGQIMWRARYRTPKRTHRVVWELARGPIPEGMQVNHKCDNGLCVRLDHLYLGTQADNIRDASERGRSKVPHRTRVFTAEQRVELHERLRGATWSDVKSAASQHGVTTTCIHNIKKGRFVRPAMVRGDAHV